MKHIKLEKYEEMDKIEKHEREHEKSGILLLHEGGDFRKMVFSVSTKSLTHPGELNDILRPSSLSLPKSQVQAYADMFKTLYPYLQDIAESNNPVDQIKILTAGILANLFSELLSSTEKTAVVPMLGETLIVN
jgi:hypothetical protein